METVKVEGLEQFRARLEQIPRELRRRVLRNVLAAGAREVRDTARRAAPVLSGLNLSAPYRKPGTVRDAIRVRTSKAARQAGDVGVFVNVKPVDGAKYRTATVRGLLGGKTKVRLLVKRSARGAHNPNDPFYWRFLEFGTAKMAARPFLQRGVDRLPQALRVIERAIGAWIAKIDKSGQVSNT